MSHLHLINKSGQPLTLCMRTHKKGDSVLFIENGVYCPIEFPKQIKILAKKSSLYVLLPDIQARGLENEYLSLHHFSPINFSRFVELTEQYQTTLTWF